MDINLKYNMLATLTGRETIFLGQKLVVRGIKAHSIKFLDENMKTFEFDKKNLNIYYSLARLYKMPLFSFNRNKRKEDQKYFNKNFDKFIFGFDYGLDFDNHDKTDESFKECYENTKKVKDLFDEYKVPYEIKSSGSGFHININDWVISKSLIGTKIKNKLEFYTKIIKALKIILNLKSLDESVMDIRRIWKAPYSIDVKTGNIALPLTDIQFEMFDFKMLKPESVMKLKLFKRGNLERDGTVEGFNKFLNDYVVEE